MCKRSFTAGTKLTKLVTVALASMLACACATSATKADVQARVTSLRAACDAGNEDGCIGYRGVRAQCHYACNAREALIITQIEDNQVCEACAGALGYSIGDL